MPTTGVLVATYIDTLKARRLSPETIRTVRHVLVNLSLSTGRRLDELTPADLAGWQTRRAEQVSGRTLRTQVSVVRCFYTWTVEQDILPVDPAARMRVPRVPATLPRPISEGRLEAALDAADPIMAAVLALAAFAGLRAIEIARLTWGDVYLDDPDPYLRVLGKGDREGIVDVSLQLRDYLRAVPGGRRGPVFKRADGQPGHNTANRISKLANEHLHAHDVPDTLHSLRHRFVTQVARVGGIHRAREAARHANISTTAGYAQVVRREVGAIVHQIGHVLPA